MIMLYPLVPSYQPSVSDHIDATILVLGILKLHNVRTMEKVLIQTDKTNNQ